MKTFYMEVNNRWDATRCAEDERAAVEMLFPNAAEIKCTGADNYEGAPIAVYEVTDADEHFEVYVLEKI